MITVAQCGAYTVKGEDAHMFYRAILAYEDGLRNYRTWVKATGLPGEKEALKSIDEEIAAYRGMIKSMYEEVMGKALLSPDIDREQHRKNLALGAELDRK